MLVGNKKYANIFRGSQSYIFELEENVTAQKYSTAWPLLITPPGLKKIQSVNTVNIVGCIQHMIKCLTIL